LGNLTKGLARGAVVVICSDGWDRGDPEFLDAEMARLARLARRIIWVNPLKASPGYVPLARGMSVALRYVDDFLEGHALFSLEELAKAIAGARYAGRRALSAGRQVWLKMASGKGATQVARADFDVYAL